MTEQEAYRRRRRMVEEQIAPRAVQDPRVLAAMRLVPRHLFVPDRFQKEAYDDNPVAIGHGQTISQPFIVASMTQELQLASGARVLEIGTGCGYQTAILAELCQAVFSIERIPELSERAAELLQGLGFRNCLLRSGDGYQGWPERAPFNGIIVTAAAPFVPEPLLNQLAVKGRLVIPVAAGDSDRQQLFAIDRTETGFERHMLYEVKFVPLVPGTE